jgi:uncharacterized phiE125 gp8 family phage protein
MIDSLSNVKTALLISGSGDDTLLNQLMDGADAYIASITGRDFVGGTYTELFAAGQSMLFLANYPVTSVTSVKVDVSRQFGSDTVLDASAYVLHADRGLIESLNGPFLTPRSGVRDDWPAAVQVVYATATSTVPTPVSQAFSQIVGHWYRQAKTFADQDYPMLLQQTSGTDTKEWSWSIASGLTLPPSVMELLTPYRVPVV